MKLIIDRKTWLRGEGHKKSFLVRESDGKQCCLGFLAQACGFSKEELTKKRSVLSLFIVPVAENTYSVCNSVDPIKRERIKPTVLEKLVCDCDSKSSFNNAIGSDLMDVNDDPKLSDYERETKLTELFATVGVEVEFRGQP